MHNCITLSTVNKHKRIDILGLKLVGSDNVGERQNSFTIDRQQIFRNVLHMNIVHYSFNIHLEQVTSLSLSLSLHFPGEPGLASVYWSKGWWRWWWQLDYWSYKSCKAPVKSSPPTNQHPVFYMPDALPVAQPTVSKHWRENITFHGLAYPKLTWGSSNFVSDH